MSENDEQYLLSLKNHGPWKTCKACQNRKHVAAKTSDSELSLADEELEEVDAEIFSSIPFHRSLFYALVFTPLIFYSRIIDGAQ